MTVPDLRTRGARIAGALAPFLSVLGWVVALVALVVGGVWAGDCRFRWRHERLYPGDTYQPSGQPDEAKGVRDGGRDH